LEAADRAGGWKLTMRPQPNPRAAWPSHDDNGGFFLIVILVGSGILAWVLWVNFHAAISSVVMALYHDQIVFLRHFTNRYDLADRQMAAADPGDVKVHDLYGIAHEVGASFRIPATVLILMLAFVATWRAAPSRYKRGFDLDGLIREQAVSFPTSAAFAKRHLRLVAPSADPRPADYALTPEEWVARFATKPDGTFDDGAAFRNFALQLGPPWRGVEQAQPHVRALFAAFALHLASRRVEAQLLLGGLSDAMSAAGDDAPDGPAAPLCVPDAAVIKADAALRDFDVLAPAVAVAARHGYAHTALMALLNEARLKAGVLAPAQFVWLKLVDRRLWYALHSLGFETEGFGRYLHPNPRIEAAGARDHWAAERLSGRPLHRPEIERALQSARKVANPPQSGVPGRA
jgi:intracellular multiplication protein IcmP